jgi:hemolysin III
VDLVRGTVTPLERPRLRGVFHQWALLAALPLGIALVLGADEPRARVAAAVFAASVVAMFGASALYHRITWSPSRRLWLRRLDHAGIYGLIAGTYTPFGLLVLEGAWQAAVLAIVWTGAALAILQKLAWPQAPKWIAVVLAVGLGWVGAVVFPQLFANAGATATLLVLGGGLLYTAGALVYGFERPNPAPATFGYHEIFHLLVIAAVGLQAAAVALVVL